MYAGELLVLMGFFAATAFVILVAYLLISRKNSKLYREILAQETRAFEAFSTTMSMIREPITGSSIHISSDYSREGSEVSKISGFNASGLEENGDKSEVTDIGDIGDIGDISGKSGAKDTAKLADLSDLSSLSNSINLLEESFNFRTAEEFANYDMPAEEKTVLGDPKIDSDSGAFTSVDWSPLAGQYRFIEKIADGGMSQIFKALKINTDNEWIVKFIPKSVGALTQEAEILKRLNHVNLPSIIDVFESDEGQFLVETFVEGVGMDQVLKNHGAMPYFKALDWAEQLTQVLAYLHNMDEQFLHLDLKPSNIMVARDDKLVLIDFGISRKQSEVAGAKGATISYAAPEQLKRTPSGKAREVIEKRFGGVDRLPEERKNWGLDVRTDIYSVGVILFEIATGHIPQYRHLDMLKKAVPHGLCQIIYKCLELNPNDRYQSINELLADIQHQKQHGKSRIQFSLLAKRAASFAATAAVGLSAFGFLMGNHLIELEAMTIMTVDPPILTVSVQQSSEIRLERVLSDTGEERPLNHNNLQWEVAANEIAQVDGNRIIGLNVGETLINGIYRQNAVTMRVQVVEPMNGMVDISQRYMSGGVISVFAGTTERERVDGALAAAEFVGPGSLDITANGAMYFADSGVLRRLHNGQVETIEINPPFLTPNIVRAYGDDIFVLTNAWQDEGDFFYGIIRINDPDGVNTGAEGIFLGDAINTDVRDFFVHDGLIYFIEFNAGVGRVYLRTLNANGAEFAETLAELPSGVSAMALGEGRIFLADREQGIILAYEMAGKNSEDLRHIAGAAGERAFIDGAAPLFYQPSRLRYVGGELFVWDFNVLRKLTISEESGAVTEAITLVGRASPVYDLEIGDFTVFAEDIILPHSELMDFVVAGEVVVLTDPKRGVFWEMLG